MENSEHSEYFMENYSDETKNRLLKYWCQQAGIIVDNGEVFEENLSKAIQGYDSNIQRFYKSSLQEHTPRTFYEDFVKCVYKLSEKTK